MKSEPKIRADGICALPGCGKKLTTDSRYAKEDAFCSTGCCKEWHGVASKGLNS